MKTKLLLAAAISALSLGAAGAQAAPVLAQSDVATADTAIEQAHHRFYYGYYYNYYPYYYYSYRYCYWSYGYKYCY